MSCVLVKVPLDLRQFKVELWVVLSKQPWWSFNLGHLSSEPQRIQWPMVILDPVSNILFWNQVLVEIWWQKIWITWRSMIVKWRYLIQCKSCHNWSPPVCLNGLYYLGLALKRICEGSSSVQRSPAQVRYVTCQIIPNFFHRKHANFSHPTNVQEGSAGGPTCNLAS